MTDQEWLDVVGYEGRYQVSSIGLVKRLARTITRSDGRVINLPEMLLSLCSDDDKHKHLTVSLWDGSRATTHTVHQVVMRAFKGPTPEGLEICHENGRHEDNSVSNLRFDTHRNNMKDVVAHGLHYLASRTHCNRGHEYTPKNTGRARKNNSRYCKRCKAEDYASYMQRIRSKRSTV